jgi:transcriptional regulator with XRE-family HTH domain
VAGKPVKKDVPNSIDPTVLMRWCPCCSAWKPLDRSNFYRSAGGHNGFQRQCKLCVQSKDSRRPHLGRNRGFVYVSAIRPWLRELVNQLGWTNAARRLGVSNSMLARWLGDKQKRIQRRYAALVLQVCAEEGITGRRSNAFEEPDQVEKEYERRKAPKLTQKEIEARRAYHREWRKNQKAQLAAASAE